MFASDFTNVEALRVFRSVADNCRTTTTSPLVLSVLPPVRVNWSKMGANGIDRKVIPLASILCASIGSENVNVRLPLFTSKSNRSRVGLTVSS